MGSIIATLFTGLIQSLLGVFGLSDAQKVVKLSDQVKDDKELIKGLETKNEVEESTAKLSDSDVTNELHSKFSR